MFTPTCFGCQMAFTTTMVKFLTSNTLGHPLKHAHNLKFWISRSIATLLCLIYSIIISIMLPCADQIWQYIFQLTNCTSKLKSLHYTLEINYHHHGQCCLSIVSLHKLSLLLIARLNLFAPPISYHWCAHVWSIFTIHNTSPLLLANHYQGCLVVWSKWLITNQKTIN